MSFCYVSNNKTTIEFGAASPYFADADMLRKYSIKYSAVRNTVTHFERDPVEFSLPVTISTQSQVEGMRLLDRLQQAFEHDIRAKKPGRLKVDGYYSDAYVTTFGFVCNDSLGLYEIELTTNVLLPNPVWIYEQKHEFNVSRGDGDGQGLNYPHNYPFNFYSGVSANTIKNSFSWSCPVRIVIYGPATNPYIHIGNNRYEVRVDVPAGGMLTIDGLDKSQVLLCDRYGNSENVFSERLPGTQGSGTYIFEQIPPGVNQVVWDGSFSFDVVLLSERNWVPCTI